MAEMKRVVAIVFGHFAIALLACVIYSFARPLGTDLLSAFTVAYRIRSAVLMFIGFVPALLISGILIGYALAFAKSSAETVDRWSGTLMSYLKGAFVLSLVCIALYAFLAEGIGPYFQNLQSESRTRTKDYRDNLALATQALVDGDARIAERETAEALLIWKGSKEANELHERAKYLLASAGNAESTGKEGAASDEAMLLTGAKGLTVLKAIDLAEAELKKNDYYSAHYYAMLAYRLAKETDPNKQNAIRIAAAAWNKINEGFDASLGEEGRVLYSDKKSGYDAIQSGDYLKAYYIFLDLAAKEKKSGKGIVDPDVSRFLGVAKDGVLHSFFFMDETGDMSRFEASRDLFFVIKRQDGSSDAIFVRGVTWAKSGGLEMAYLRDFEYAHIGWDGKLAWQVEVPYAKMFPFKETDGSLKPELLLHAVDRMNKGIETVPIVKSGSVPEKERNVLVLEMPYRDFSLIVAANRGIPSMSLFELLNFGKQAETYGFSSKAILCELINRLAVPFLLLIACVYALILSWRFRLAPKAFFKAWWILAVPLFPILSWYAIQALQYVTRLVIVLVVDLVPQNPVLLVLGLLSTWFIVVSVYFFSQRAD
jgi:hypothetical protein